MTDQETTVWAAVYAAVVVACGGHNGGRDSWERIRERATHEANMAVAKYKDA